YENRFVCEGRDPILLHEHLDRVSHYLEQTERPGSVRTVAVLPKGKQPALYIDERGRNTEGHNHDSENRKKGVRTCHLGLAILPHAGIVTPLSGAIPAGTHATPRGRSGRRRTGRRKVPLAQLNSTSVPSARSVLLTKTCGFVASSASPRAARLSSSEPMK